MVRAATLVTLHVPQLSHAALLRAAVDSLNRRLKKGTHAAPICDQTPLSSPAFW